MVRENLRCFLVRREADWAARCIDTGLEASAASPEQARAALDALLEAFCYERNRASAPVGVRAVPLRERLAYWHAGLRSAPDGVPLAYVFSWPPELLYGLA